MLSDDNLPAACSVTPSPLHGRMRRPRAWGGSHFLVSSTAAWRTPPHERPRRPGGALLVPRLLALVDDGRAEPSERRAASARFFYSGHSNFKITSNEKLFFYLH
jgi:hypothetical protein